MSHACALLIDNVGNYLYLNNGRFKFDPHQFNLRLHHFSQFQHKKIKCWLVCDWLAKWLIVLGFMDLRWPRVYRRSNVGLVWSWRSRSIDPQYNRYFNQSVLHIWGPFYGRFCIVIQIPWNLHSDLPQILAKWLLRNFEQGTTALLSLRIYNHIAISYCTLELREKMHQIDFWWSNHSWI